ncbi:MAG: zinc-binding dehydrogenase [Clostridiales bacterium]|nr:zinc-binding dehydrogenase [Clostridiales bacterium]
MQNRQIQFVAPGKAELVDIPIQTPNAGQVLVRIEISSISSGTERANLIGDPNITINRGAVEVRFPRILGYSSAGVIESVGKGVTKFKPGDRVSLAWSTYTRYICISENNVYKLDDNVSFSAGALVHIATFPLAAIRKTKIEIGESVIVMGLGVLGLIAVGLARIAGAAPVIAVDPNPARRESAIRFGADAALDPFAADFIDKVNYLTGGGAKAAIEVTGNGKALDQVLDCMAKFGRVALLGCTRDSNFTIDYYRKVHGPGISLIGAHTMARPTHDSYDGYWTEKDDEQTVISLMKHGRIDLSDIVEEIYSPAAAPEVFSRLANEPSFPITQFNWSLLEDN